MCIRRLHLVARLYPCHWSTTRRHKCPTEAYLCSSNATQRGLAPSVHQALQIVISICHVAKEPRERAAGTSTLTSSEGTCAEYVSVCFSRLRRKVQAFPNGQNVIHRPHFLCSCKGIRIPIGNVGVARFDIGAGKPNRGKIAHQFRNGDSSSPSAMRCCTIGVVRLAWAGKMI